LPCLAVTVFAVAYSFVIGAGPGRLVSIAAAVLAGQLCVGWSNDAIDGATDVLAARPDKPIARGMIGRRTVAVAAVIAGLVCIPLSLLMGLAAASLHFAAVLSALAYNAGLKTTLASPVPYLFSFGLMPVITTLAVDDAERPSALRVIAAALLGGAAHFGNTVGDARADAVTGVRGLPQRLGPRRSQATMALIIGAAAAVLLAEVITTPGQGAAEGAVAAALLVAGVAVAVTGAIMHVGVRGGHSAWRLTLVAVGMVVAGFLIGA
jgi:4-hydroxybenzoate polyprenyltransferase